MESLDVLLKICGIGVLCSVCLLILPPSSGGIASALRIGGGVLLAVSLLGLAGKGIEELRAIAEGSAFADTYVSEALSLMLKGLGLAFLTKISADLCRDCGEGRIAETVEGAGRIAIFLLTLPTFARIIQYTEEILSFV